jgi:hypothetical protein
MTATRCLDGGYANMLMNLVPRPGGLSEGSAKVMQ